MSMSMNKLILSSAAVLLVAGCASPEREKEIANHKWALWAECVKHTMEFQKCHDFYIRSDND